MWERLDGRATSRGTHTKRMRGAHPPWLGGGLVARHEKQPQTKAPRKDDRPTNRMPDDRLWPAISPVQIGWDESNRPPATTCDHSRGALDHRASCPKARAWSAEPNRRTHLPHLPALGLARTLSLLPPFHPRPTHLLPCRQHLSLDGLLTAAGAYASFPSGRPLPISSAHARHYVAPPHRPGGGVRVTGGGGRPVCRCARGRGGRAGLPCQRH